MTIPVAKKQATRAQRSHRSWPLLAVAVALSTSVAFCGGPGLLRQDAHGSEARTADRQRSESSMRLLQGLRAQGAEEVQVVDAPAHNSQSRRVLLLYPDEGSPGFAEVPHVGTALTGESPSWAQSAQQLAKRVRWDLESLVDLEVMSVTELCDASEASSLPRFDLVFGVDLTAALRCPSAEAALRSVETRLFISSSRSRQVGSFWQSMTSLMNAGEEELAAPGPFNLKATLGGYTEALKLRNDIIDLWQRCTAEEAVYAMLVLIDGAVAPLPAMTAQRPVPTSESISRAVNNCQDEFRTCFTQPRCLQSLACISQCGLADQSCSYRCIVSYSSDAFTQFSLCALQKQNLLDSKIERPTTPSAVPMESFRGKPVTHEVAEGVLVGHFDPASGRRHSWLVAAGSNPAYEQFALQYQLWYKGSAKNTFWYHPTFLVEALDGQKLWRTRDYRVRRKQTPGMWDFSVVDNGIISEERWHLLGADENLEWCVLFYVGVARKAGLAYRGCLVLTRDGDMPGPEHAEALSAAIARAGMKPWELEATNNPAVDPDNRPPLIAPETQPAAPLLVPA